MPNIYLKVPTYVAQFYRNRDIGHPLTEFQPVIFSPFQVESVIMNTWLMMGSENVIEHTACFSQRIWNNMLNGKLPQGGRIMLKRDPQEWLTMDEVTTLTQQKRNNKTDGFDYLCIETPKAVIVGQHYKQVTPSYTLPFTAANDMIRRLRQEFIRVLVEWIRKEIAYCDIQGIQRDVTMCVDHFFFHYNMCLGTNNSDRDSMRRMAKRWMEDSRILTDSITDEDVLFVYESERNNRKPTLDELLKELRDNIKED